MASVARSRQEEAAAAKAAEDAAAAAVAAPPEAPAASEEAAAPPPAGGPTGTMLYDFAAQEDWQVSASAGEVVQIVTNDGEGWIDAQTAAGRGLIPANYMQVN